MNREELRRLLVDLRNGGTEVDAVLAALQAGPFRTDRLSFATLDHHRALRQGLPEVVYGEGKRTEEIVEIVRRLSDNGDPILASRLSAETQDAVLAEFPGARVNRRARTCLVNPPTDGERPEDDPFVGIVAAGTSDLPVAEEAVEVCVAMDIPRRTYYDVGVSGLHRLLEHVDGLQRAAALVVVAGMEGALPSVVAGLVSCPVIGVPTSVGYGTSFGGIAPLLAMLNSCAPGLTVANIDNGFSAGVAAARVVQAVRARVAAESGR
jgi:NCAIR mutase (PurE)-related protein